MNRSTLDSFTIIKRLGNFHFKFYIYIIGEGAYSNVYHVIRKENEKEYALKKVKLAGLSEKEKENSINEVRILASIKNPYVVSYKEAFIDESSDSLW